MTPDDFSRQFAASFGAQDAKALAALIAPDGTAQTLTGAWAEGRAEAAAIFQAEAAGIFARAKLVTGKGTLTPLGPETTLLRQRFVVSGAVAEDGSDLPRIAAMLVAVLVQRADACHAVSLTFSAVA
jgi:ketosteroid isomerase-like protein